MPTNMPTIFAAAPLVRDNRVDGIKSLGEILLHRLWLFDDSRLGELRS